MRKNILRSELLKIFTKHKLSKKHSEICADYLIKAELVDANGNVPTGFNKENSDAVTSDTSRIRMTWRGESESPSDGLRVRFYIRQAFIYGFQFVDAG